ncbi:DNA primase regulatory subunit PriL [Natronorarus salvus]|uniref:DNA primase regulatory subunit PriL n=1 Tax=Natronorarus salvus TaxID=3117733 RepID=UPI002F262AE2
MEASALHARYPFLASAREAVETAGVDLVDVVSERAVVERATERVTRAITDGEVGEPHRTPRTELLSYPVARVLVSLVDEHVLTRKYARAEAKTARERIETDRRQRAREEGLRSVSVERLTLAELLAEFDLEERIRAEGDEYAVAVGSYVGLSAGLRREDWRLVNRVVADGEVFVTEPELIRLVQEAIARRVGEGLPLSVPDAIAEPLDGEIEAVRELLSEYDFTREIDTVVPDRFPPCMKALLDAVQKGEHLEHHSRFAITTFLVNIGMSTDEIIDLYMVNPGFGEKITRYQTDHIRGETSPTEYSPPSCATMQSYGDCVNMDDRCETISHPLAYYEKALDEADEDELVDWREGGEEAEG